VLLWGIGAGDGRRNVVNASLFEGRAARSAELIVSPGAAGAPFETGGGAGEVGLLVGRKKYECLRAISAVGGKVAGEKA
jgi:hypothetical protein